MNRLSSLVVALALFTAACSGGDDSGSTTRTTSTAPPPPSTTTAAPPTTLAPQTLPPTSMPVERDERDPCGLIGLPAAVGIGDPYFPTLGNPGYDVNHYVIEFEFDPVADRLEATTTISATAAMTLPDFNLDFSGLTITDLDVDGSSACFVEDGEDVFVQPPAPVVAGEDFTVEVSYVGSPGPTRSAAIPFGIGWQNSVSGQSYVVAEPDAAHTWFPSNDHPRDKATYTFRITVPDGTTVAANGALVDQIDDDAGTTWVWEMDRPMASYLATVVIGDFTIVIDDAASRAAGVPIRHVLPGATGVADWPGLERQGEMLAFLSELFGPYPYDRYGIAIVDGFGAALENQTLSLFDTDVARSDFFEDVLVHELAHQWFGDSVSPESWQDIWLNEGFASYAEWLWLERASGSAELTRGITSERSFFATAGLPPAGIPPPDDLFNAAVYRVGAMTLHALRLTVGDDAFFQILRDYAQGFRDGVASTSDFVAVAERVSGAELDDLFDAWLLGDALPLFPNR